MAYLRPVQAVGRPDSIAPVADSTNVINRGQALFLDPTTGKAMGDITGSTTSKVFLGFADDNKTTTLVAAVKGGQYTTAAVVANGSVLPSIVFSTGKIIVDPVVASMPVALPANWSLEVYTGGTWVPLVATGAQILTMDGNAGTFTINSSGAVTLPATLPSATYNVRLTADFDYSVVSAGNVTVSDMFSNDSTVASGLVTYWFMPGIYETDMYDPLTNFTVGAEVGILANGKFCLASAGLTELTSGNPYVVGTVLQAPLPNYNGYTKTTDGHKSPAPEALRILFNPSFVALA